MSFPLSTFGNTDQVLQSLEVLGDGHINGNLDVDGTVTASQFAGGTITPSFSLPDGSASDPSLAFQSSTNSGLFWDTSGTVSGQAWSSNGTKRLKLDPDQLQVTGPMLTDSIDCGTNSLSCGSSTSTDYKFHDNSIGKISCDANDIFLYPGMTGGTNGFLGVGSTGTFTQGNAVVTGYVQANGGLSTSSGGFTGPVIIGDVVNCGTNSMTCGGLTCTSCTTGPITQPNNTPILAHNSSGALETFCIPRSNGNTTSIRYGSGGFFIVTNTGTNVWGIGGPSGADFQSFQQMGGLSQAASVVVSGIANGSLNINVVLVAGTATISNIYVTILHLGFASVITTGGTPGAYRVQCGTGTYTVTSTSATDTSTLAVFFIRSF